MLHSEASPAPPTAAFAHPLSREDWPVLIALPAICAVLVLGAPRLGWWMIVVAAAVYAIGMRAFLRSQQVDDTYGELLVALGRVGEMNGTVVPGHADRTAQLAVAMGERLGVGPQQRATIEAAARARSAGSAGWEQSPHVRPGFDHRTAARWSATVVGPSGRLREVAALVAPDVDSVLGDIVEVAATFDEAVHAMGMSPEAAYTLVSRNEPPEEAAVTIALGAILAERGVVLRASVLDGGSALAMDPVAE